MEPELSLGARRRGQRAFLWFSLFNVISFNFLSGNIIALYALQLGADSLLIGLLAAFVSVAELLPSFGRLLVRRFGAVRVMALAWIVRYLLMAPLLASPYLVQRTGGRALALGLCVVSALGFNLSRGIGITGHNPIVGAVTSSRDRGAFLSRNQLIIQVMSIVTGVAMALLLGTEAGQAEMERYTAILGIGIVAGLVGSVVLLGVPEPLEARRSAGRSLWASLRKGLERRAFRRFLVVLFLTLLLLNMAGPFLIVFLKRGYLQGDDAVVIFTVLGSLGAIVTALIAGMALDRFGAKPFCSIFLAIVVVALVFPIVSPSLGGSSFWFYAGALFFLYSLGSVGLGTALNTYFFTLIDPGERLNLGIAYFMATGLAGTVGSLSGGALLQALQGTGTLGAVAHGLPAFRVYYGLLVGGLVLLFPAILALEKQGSRDVREVLSSMLSFRDLRAIVLLGRLARTGDVTDERRVIQALGELPSDVAGDEILERLGSPMYAIRAEALNALRNQSVDSDVEAALITEIRSHQFTTAHLAAEIVGSRGLAAAAPHLREALGSRDYMLQASAMIALARLGDRAGIATVRELVAKTDNPRLVIYGAQALEIAGGLDSLEVLLGRLADRQYPYVRDEIILCVAGLLGMKGPFYGWYRQYLERSLLGLTAVRDYMQERILAGETSLAPPELLTLALEETTGRGEGFATAVRESLGSLAPVVDGRDARPTLLECLEEPSLMRLERFRFLVASALVWLSFAGSDKP